MSLSRALDLWIAVTGVDPSRTAFRFGDMDVLNMHNALKEALELDDTEVTGRLLFAYIASEYFRERSFSVEELLDQPEKVAPYLAQSRELRTYLQSEELQAIRADFTGQLTKAVASYGAASPELTELLDSPHSLALLRRDAMRTLKHLQINQFLDGNPEPENARPLYGKFVYQWRNINSMLKVMTTMPSGVTVNLICHPTEPRFSYFAFAIRNGGKIFVFTDKEATPHPLAENLRRRPERILAARAARNWFPYELMGLSFNEEGEAYIRRTESTGLVPMQTTALPVKPIAELGAPTVLWLAMMLDLIVEKFWRQGYRAPELSYTGEMIQIETPLIEAAEKANLPVAGYQPLALRPLAVADVSDENAAEAHVGRRGEGKNKWLEDRFGHLVPESILNLLSTPDKALALEHKDGASVVVPRISDNAIRSWGSRPSQTSLDSLDATSFGSRAEIEADRRFIARANYAKEIDRLARQEYAERHKDVEAWVRRRIEANLPALYPLLARPEVQVPARRSATFDSTACGWRDMTPNGYRRCFLTRRSLTDGSSISACYSDGSVVFQGPSGWVKKTPPCFKTNAAASFAVRIYPESAADLAFLCGCTVSELPDVLQHWTQFTAYVGNSILNRVDPMEWQCNDPWRKLTFEINFMLSIRAMKAIDKEFGAAPLPDGFFAG